MQTIDYTTAVLKHQRDRLIQQLRQKGISNPDVLEVMRLTPRHIFIDEALSSYAYTNHAIPIGYGQTISQPYVVARMTEALLSQGTVNKVLEVGTGCGYQTAILAQLIDKVYSVERIKPLSEKASQHLKSLGLDNVQLGYGDGHWGWAEYAPYQSIIVTAAPTEIPKSLLSQLRVGGCLVIPVGPQNEQVLLKIIRTRSHYQQSILEAVKFVPMCQGLS
jgi:protein-L-isoaspartate(D-aspartate) O-methyltransferase